MEPPHRLIGGISLRLVREAVGGGAPRDEAPFPDQSSAAVAVLLAGASEGLELMLIRRATRPDDPRSGQMGLPGGRWEPGDGPLWRTAVRETREETGIALEAAELMGCLPPIAAVARGRRVGIGIVPFVFSLAAPAMCTPNEEVAEALWTPVDPLYRGDCDTTVEFDRDGSASILPGWDVRGRVVWGLTHTMLDGLFRKIRAATGG